MTRKRNQKTQKSIHIRVLVFVCCVLTVFLGRQFIVQAVFDESEAVSFQEYSASHTIEESMLFIGTWLVHTQSLTDEIYEKALDSAAESNQTSVYYKSELAGGAWFDITEASGISEISGSGTIAEESEMADLWVTCYTGADGITVDARNGNAVNIFDISDPYDLHGLSELEAIQIQYDNTLSEESTGVDAYYYDTVTEFFELDVTNETTDSCDKELAALQECYTKLQSEGKSKQAETVHKLMGKVDAKRRAEVFSVLSQTEENEIGKLQEACMGTGYDADAYDGKDFMENTNISDAIGTALQKCMESYIAYSGNMLEENDDILKNAEYEASKKIIEMAQGGATAELEEELEKLGSLYQIENGTTADAEKELELLDSVLIEQAEEKYKEQLSAGENAAYQAAEESGMSIAAKQKILEEQKAELDAAKAELQYLIQAKTEHMDAEAACKFAYNCVQEAESFLELIKEDDFKSSAEASVQEHMLWGQKLAAAIISKNDALKPELEQLEEQKQELLNEKAEALDNNDLALAKKCDAQITLIDEKIEAKVQELNKILNSPDSTTAEKVQAANQLGTSTVLNNINELKNNALEALAEGDADIESAIGALAALGADGALKEIREKAEGYGQTSLLEKIDEALEKSKESSLHGLYGDTEEESSEGEGSGGEGGESGGEGSEGEGGTSGGEGKIVYADKNALLAMIEEELGVPFEELNEADKASAIAALNRIGNNGNPFAAEMAVSFTNAAVKDKNPYIYRKLEGEPMVYAPLKVISICNHYRYVYTDSLLEAVLIHKSIVYKFTVHSNKVVFADASQKDLTTSVKMQNLPYLSAEDARELFRCYAEYITGTEYGVCLNQKMSDKAELLVEEILEYEEEEK
uniref:hypothetical protein n=1 Tax=Agathobacter sp. TaxID=2021311 RepID=UPI004055A740